MRVWPEEVALIMPTTPGILRAIVLPLLLASAEFVFAATLATSIPHPTDLERLADTSEAILTQRSSLGEMRVGESEALIDVVSVESATGQGVQGIRLRLQNSKTRSVIYLDEAEVNVLIADLNSLEPLTTCSAGRSCISSVARCRPSQTERQALCPSYYYSVQSQEHGLGLRTPSGSFHFPSLEARVLIDILKQYEPRGSKQGTTE